MADNEIKAKVSAEIGTFTSAMEQVQRDIEKATQAAQLAGDVFGIEVPKALAETLAKSALVGPALEAAFPVLAVLDLIEVLAHVPEKLDKWIEKLGELGEAEKKFHQKVIDDGNDELKVKAKILGAEYDLQIANAKTDIEKQDLRVQKATALVGIHQTYVDSLTQEKKRLADLLDAANQSTKESSKELEKWQGTMEGTLGTLIVAGSEMRAEAYGKELKRFQQTIDLATAELKEAEADKANIVNTHLQQRQQQHEAALKSRLAQWTAELNQMRQQTAAYHTLSLQDEQAFWQNKKSMVQQEQADLDNIADPKKRAAKAKELAAELRQIDTQLAGDKKKIEAQDLSDFQQYVQLQVAATKSGSKERVDLYDGALEIMRNAGAQDTKEYQHLLEQRAAAFRQYTDKQTADAKRAADVQARIQEIDAESDKHHWEDRRVLEQAGFDFERQLGRMSEGEYEKHLQQLLADTYKHEREDLQVKLNAAKQGTEEYARVRAEMKRLDDKYLADVENAERKSYERRHQAMLAFIRQGVAVHQQLEQAFIGDLNNMNASLASFITTGQANWKQFASSAIEEIIKIGLQWVESQLLMKLFGDAGRKSETESDIAAVVTMIEAQAQLAAATAYAFNAWDPPGAAAAAAAAEGIVAGFSVAAGALSAGAISAAGGAWEIDREKIALVHPGESIIPAKYAAGLRSLVEHGPHSGNSPGGGGNITVVVNHSVNAIDAASFQNTIKRHGNIIGNEVARVLKLKGFGGK